MFYFFLTTFFVFFYSPRSTKICIFILMSVFVYSYIYITNRFVKMALEEIRYPEWNINLIDLFTRKISYNNNIQKTDCSICMENFKLNEELREINCSCNSIYHTDCIVKWFEKKCSCPLCRRSLDEKIHYL